MGVSLLFLPPWACAALLAVLALPLSLGLGRLIAWLPGQIDEDLPPTRLSTRSQTLFSLLCALLAAACGWRFGLGIAGLSAMVFVLVLATLAWIDAVTGLLPDLLTLSLLWLGLLINLGHVFTALPDAVIGAAAGYLFFWLIYQTFLLLTQREGLGFGDFKLLAALGAWLGWAALPNIILLASVSALLITLLRRWRSGADMAMALHYGPYLAAAGILQLFWSF